MVWPYAVGGRDTRNTDCRGAYDLYSEAIEYVIQQQYLRSHSMVYLIQARGHIRMVAAPKILGISANTHRSAIWEHGYEEFDE